MATSTLLLVGLIGHFCISVSVVLYVNTHKGNNPANENAKSENTASWALGVITNLAIGIILLLVEKFII